ncbi:MULTISPECIES: cation-transporting P-type ATPase [Clostridium]|uniref:Cation-transporting P-type ATPase n=1 Tax=Clostridium cibarium TaxID=2762247 RepID=A0ABR8PNS3_9CLOT|nr:MULTISPECIES: cation-transporting P-type ATPase [Clostridium]MBD7909809.1 cation-transporting P-type ATPase [Clostridium cibarium]
MNIYSNNSWKAIVEMLKSDIYKGLSEEECEKERKNSGDNRVFVPYKNGFIASLKNFFSIYIFLSVAIIGVLFYYSEYVMGSISTAIILISLIIKIIYTKNKTNKMKFLQNLNNTTTKVLRNGIPKEVKSEELVKGDIVYFSKGSLVPADIRIITANEIKVDEKNITGENFLKEKFDSKIDEAIYSIAEMKNMLFKGSSIAEGEGTGIVVATGNLTELGKMFTMIMDASKNKHTLGKRVEKKVGKIMIILSLVAIGTSIGSYYFQQNLYGLCLSLFAIQVMPLISIAFLYGIILKKDLHKKGIDLVNMSTLDIINEIEILFMDKIGSVTKEEMIVDKLYVNNKIFESKEIIYNREVTIKRLIETIVLCNNSTYDADQDLGEGELKEVAYLKFANEKMAYKSMLEANHRRVFEIPMDTDKRVITTINKVKQGSRANCRGNVDAILDRCSYIMIDGLEKEITPEDVERIKAIDYNFSLEGLITQGIAYRSFSYTPSREENIENNLVFVGLVALDNPLNDDIEEEISEIKNRGIIPIMITDDNKIVATSLGKKAKLVSSNNKVISGIEIYSLGNEELIDTVSRTRVFSRVTPELKARIIGLFIKDKYKVAASGESLGELPTISLSNLGIGKGDAPKIIKNAADLFIKNNYLKGFLSIFDIARKFNDGLAKVQAAIITMLFSEIVIINTLPLINNNIQVSYIPIIIINVILAIPLFLTLIHSPRDDDNKFILRSIVYSVLALAAIYDANSSFEIVLVATLGAFLLINTFINVSIPLKRVSAQLVLFIVSILIWLMSVGGLIFLYGLTLSIFAMVKIGVIILINLIYELILKRCQ